MSCKQCGSPCQGGLCQFCEFDQAREGDWQDQLGGYDAIDEDDGEIDELELRGQLLETAIEYHHLKCDAEANGRTEQAGYFERQYEQALTGFNSLRGDT